MNTKLKGEFNVLIVNKGDEVVGICPEFAIVKYGEDFGKVHQDIVGASKAYLKSIVQNDLPDDLLYRFEELPRELQVLYNAVSERIEKKKTSKDFKKLPKNIQKAVSAGNAFLSPVCA